MVKAGYGSRAAKHAARVFKLELEVAMLLFKEFNTPRSLTCKLLIENGEWEQYLDLKVDPSHYSEEMVEKFRSDLQATRILQKCPRLPSGINTSEKAISKFYDAEERCTKTNNRIREFIENRHIVDPEIVKTVYKAQSIISRILGHRLKTKDLEFAYNNMRFGPGATTSVSGIVTQGKKYSNSCLDCTKDLVAFRAFSFPHLWGRMTGPDIKICRGSRFTTVPKDAKVDRGICIEPDLNIFVQLGFGALLRKKLSEFGLDLNTQVPNQELAKRAWVDGLCTIDLSSASDTISTEVVKLLLPNDWYEGLLWSRSPETFIEGRWVPLEKWSSMGNGYTFELESLLFFGLALAATPERDSSSVRVFGDDIIVPEHVMPLLIRTLEFLGFSVNSEKSFGKGIFHESCGTDWFCGHNVRPFFLRSTHNDFTQICMLYANSISRWACRCNGGWSRDSRCLPSWLRCYSAVSAEKRYHIPDGCGDGGFCSDFDRASPSLARSHNKRTGWGGYWFKYWYTPSVELTISVIGSYLSSLNHLSATGGPFPSGKESLRGRYRPAITKIGHSHKWPILGPWL